MINAGPRWRAHLTQMVQAGLIHIYISSRERLEKQPNFNESYVVLSASDDKCFRDDDPFGYNIWLQWHISFDVQGKIFH